MDRTHFLAAQSFSRHTGGRPTRAEIDRFYEHHGHAVFALACRLRRALRARAARVRTAAQRNRDFAAVTSGR